MPMSYVLGCCQYGAVTYSEEETTDATVLSMFVTPISSYL